MKKLVYEGEFPLSIFMRAFANHVESNTLENETTKANDSFWYGSISKNGEFELGYHYAQLQTVSGHYYGKRMIDICGTYSSENGITTITYSRTLKQFAPFVLLVALLVIFSLQAPISAWDVAMWSVQAILAIISLIVGYFCFPRYDRILKEHMETMLRECQYMMESSSET